MKFELSAYKKYIALIALLAVLAVFYSFTHAAVKENRKDLAFAYQLNVTPLPPDLIKIVAGEFRGLMSDYLLLEIGSHLGSNQKLSDDEWEKVALAFEQALELDPYFQQTYLYAQGILPWREMPEKAISLLDISGKYRSWDWRPGYYMGFDYYYFFKDFSLASDAFLDAAKVKNAPALLAVLGGRFAHKSGRTKAAIGLLQSMLQDPELDENTEKEISDRITALKGVVLLEHAIKKYMGLYNAFPPSLEALIDKGLIGQLPKNPYSDSFIYKPEGGRVFFDKVG
ncbi:MAG: hypothetical protein GY864_06025 [Desulfobacterales bacterium]|nr:hypothetical protein [Desulfobacterales bacterium]